MTFAKPLMALALIAGMTISARAETEAPNQPGNPFPQLEETAKRFFTMLEYLVMTIPQYEAPEILENGDVIIRRKHPKNEAPSPPSPQKDTPPSQRKI